ncbi:MAG: L-glutamate gamma-semialdehyde dehydrogenase [Ignavibacteriales bacterium]|nr:L-glutamate gamma-semialdehyde dehydrogenase [Ignavibacteriales bacterium]MCF8304986.1 L-glutamate gamma-semialdehyde dehydrogenase [Ignavibacteriales bacterium]MCF8314675.1 L-glutamate gamma-semialdehyde dehydrogenase [Ignavibacteriales bacterium]MCF8436288.1 L-glutamate gamma-semialdehyde dehydrogenase [Ignavibacteriales bacterium]
MANAYFYVPETKNENPLSYLPGSREKESLKRKLTELKSKTIEIPLIIGGKEVKTGKTSEIRAPHDHSVLLGIYHKAGKAEVEMAIEAALKARQQWADLPWEQRASILRKAAELLTGPWRDTLNAATMLGQSKTAHQAEIEAACELADFWRFNPLYLTRLMSDQPYSPTSMWNRVEYRALEGFVFAVTPFNFTAIAGNLPTAPALCGNVVLWKPASSAVYSAYFLMKLLEEAGMPAGVLNFIPGSGGQVGNPVLESPDLAGIHFTGSTAVFQDMLKKIADNGYKAKYYPRIVGETGGKDFIFAHNKADVDALVVAAIRGSFEYQGQKCSAASRMYIPKSIYPDFKKKYVAEVNKIKVGDPEDFTNFMCAVIDKGAFESIVEYIEYAKKSPDAEFITGGKYDSSKGYFIDPTTIVTTDPMFKTMQEEIFGPVLTIYVYEDEKFEETLDLCDKTSPYALTGAIWSQDRFVLNYMMNKLQNAAGNFYINDKPTAAIVNQQPFGGGRASGTNDKAGSAMNLLRWLTARSIKETFDPPKDWRYPFMDAE